MDFSIKEAEALCYKAARGAGYSWGLAEEAGFAAGWLAKTSLSDFSDFASLLAEKQNEVLTTLRSSGTDNDWAADSDGKLCPISTGAFLSDNQNCLIEGKSISINNVAHPILLIPFIGNVSLNSKGSVEVIWGTAKACVKGAQVSLTNNGGSLTDAIADKVTLRINPDCQPSPQDHLKRCTVSDPTLTILHKFAHKTYVPETEELMRVGAGGENVDDDG